MSEQAPVEEVKAAEVKATEVKNSEPLNVSNIDLSSGAIAVNASVPVNAVSEDIATPILKQVFGEDELTLKNIVQSITLAKTVVNKDTYDQIISQLKKVIAVEGQNASLEVLELSVPITNSTNLLRSYFNDATLKPDQKRFIKSNFMLVVLTVFINACDTTGITSAVQSPYVINLFKFANDNYKAEPINAPTACKCTIQ
jgi:hypothetical protein